MHTVSKTDYLLYRECHKNTWLKIHKPDVYYTNELSDFEKSIIETGNEVESKARLLFPTGILIEGHDIVAQEKTSKIIKDLISSSSKKSADQDSGVGLQTIFQPVFVKDGFMAAVDVLQFDPSKQSFSLYEIKASNNVKEKLHLYDLAFQVNLLKMVGLQIDRIGVLHLNPKYIRNGDLDIIKLFVKDDVTESVNEILEKVSVEMRAAQEYLSGATEPSGPCDCIYKGRSGHCTTFSYSNVSVPEYSVHDIARIGLSKNKLIELIDGNIFDIKEVPEYIELSEIQKNQVNVLVSDRVILEKDKIFEELNSLVFPLYFIDYETFPSAIPRFDGFSPYQQIPFQYSLHVVEKAPLEKGEKKGGKNSDENGSEKGPEPIHREFLHTESNDPSLAFLEAMQKDIGKIGSIIVWNKSFECNRNIELAKRFPQFKEFVEEVNARVYDLEDIFKKQYFVHKGFKGKTSIKYILPVIAPELTYKNLNIQNGGSASDTWNRLVTGQILGSEKTQTIKDLLKYCERDSYAMYAIWKHLWDANTVLEK